MSCPPHFFNVPTPSKDVLPVARCRKCGHKREVLNSLPGMSYWRNAKGVRPKTAGRKKAKA
jgi:hypothetical protein